ncbi:MAG: peptide deformylase [Deltaproteobacteria bacterium]|nr:MAG: peptide deformylase [Deltaproteobacteria bacterium]
MAILHICTYPEEILHQRAEPITEIDEEVVKLVDHMAETMYSAPGIGLAATQVGVAKQVLVADIAPRRPESELIVLINPEIVAAEGEVIFEEGCLSVPDYQAEVKRHERITVRGLNLKGEEVEIEAEGLLAIVLQHEIDHLNGVLFIDRLSKLKRDLYKRRMRKKVAKGQS